jgi:probable rRNA maturation factor
MISVTNRQRIEKVDLWWLRRAARAALPLCREVSDDDKFALRRFEEISVAIVSDAAIAQIHEEFMGIAGATDVITFEHGEIVMSAETARDYAVRYDHTIEEELLLYTIHGLLHLNGFDDQTTAAAARMKRVQTRIWREVLASSTPTLTTTPSPCPNPSSPPSSSSRRSSRPGPPSRTRHRRT